MKKIQKQFFHALICIFVCASLFCFSNLFIGCGNQQAEWETNYALPEEEAVNERLLEIYSSPDKLYLLGDTISRMPCPENGQAMVFNMTYQVNEYVKICLEDAIAEINEIFKVVNPNFKFKINYHPTKEDFSSKYSIRMNITDHFSSPTVMGTAQVSTGKLLSNFGITLKDTTLNDIRYLMLTFRHEFMHLLGAGDAYKNPNADTTTVMQDYTHTKYRTFSSSDVAFIDAYYRNPSNPNSDAFIKNFIANYETNFAHSQNALLSKVVRKSLKNIDAQAFSAQLNAFHYKNVDALLSISQNGININQRFGESEISFTELEFQQEFKPASTYYGAFNPADKKYMHGTQKGSMVSSMKISYQDVGNGILIAMPNGNITIFVEVENFVLCMQSDNMFLSTDGTYGISFDGLEYNLIHACAMDE